MNVQFCAALLALCSLTAAVDPDCEELVKPVEDRSRLSGRWILYAGTTDSRETMAFLETINSSWIELSVTPDGDNMTLAWGDKMNGSCLYGNVKCVLLGNSTQVTFNYNSSTRVHVGQHLKTCPDCVVWTGTVMEGTREARSLYIFTKNGTLDASDFEVFKKQTACLNLQPDYHFAEATDLCPDAPDAKEREQ